MNSKYAKEVAETIIQQLGGYGKLKAMIGAKNFVYALLPNPSLSFKFMKGNKGVNAITIMLTPMDDYDLFFQSVPRSLYSPVKEIKKINGVYAEQLKNIFENVTGLRLSL